VVLVQAARLIARFGVRTRPVWDTERPRSEVQVGGFYFGCSRRLAETEPLLESRLQPVFGPAEAGTPTNTDRLSRCYPQLNQARRPEKRDIARPPGFGTSADDSGPEARIVEPPERYVLPGRNRPPFWAGIDPRIRVSGQESSWRSVQAARFIAQTLQPVSETGPFV
jgi:hypothetical protein